MGISKVIPAVMLAFAGQAAMADTPPPENQTPFGELQTQIDALSDRVDSLEANAPTSDVEGRSYCMMVNITVQRGWSNTATEEMQKFIVRRVATFTGGALIATTIDGLDIRQDDNGVITGDPVVAGEVLGGTYTQTGQRLDVLLDTGASRVWYVSADGSVIHNNSADHFGPFPNSISVGVTRNATFIESDTCDNV
jgi:hypothetical protein